MLSLNYCPEGKKMTNLAFDTVIDSKHIDVCYLVKLKALEPAYCYMGSL